MDFDVLVHTNVLEVGGYTDEPPLEQRAAAQAHLFRQLYDPDRQRAVINLDGAPHVRSLDSHQHGICGKSGFVKISGGAWWLQTLLQFYPLEPIIECISRSALSSAAVACTVQSST